MCILIQWTERHFNSRKIDRFWLIEVYDGGTTRFKTDLTNSTMLIIYGHHINQPVMYFGQPSQQVSNIASFLPKRHSLANLLICLFSSNAFLITFERVLTNSRVIASLDIICFWIRNWFKKILILLADVKWNASQKSNKKLYLTHYNTQIRKN